MAINLWELRSNLTRKETASSTEGMASIAKYLISGKHIISGSRFVKKSRRESEHLRDLLHIQMNENDFVNNFFFHFDVFFVSLSFFFCLLFFFEAISLLYWREYNRLFIFLHRVNSRLLVSVQRYFSLYMKLRHLYRFSHR